MIAVDTSVVVTAALPWQRFHDEAVAALVDAAAALPAHVAVEAYSVLTRIAPPRRRSPSSALRYLRDNFESRTLPLSAGGYERLLDLAAAESIVGGAIYDALIATTALEHGATLLTLDRRAERTYRLVGVDYRLL